MSAGLTWYVEPEPWKMGSASLQSGLAWALKHLSRRGVRVPLTGRHQRALQVLAHWNSEPRGLDLDAATPTDLQRIQAAHRTAWELLLITCAAWRYRRKHRTPFTLNKLNAMMKGGEFPSSTHTQPWDIQFELLAGAMLVHGGLEVMPGEPDLRFLYGYEKVGLAAKRLTSTDPSQAERHMNKAVQQIGGTGLRGWVALNLDTRFTHVRLADERAQLLDEFTTVFDSVTHALKDHIQNKEVLGVMLYGYLSEWVKPAAAGEKARLSTSAPFRWQGWVDDDGAQRLFYSDFVGGWRARVSDQLRTVANGRCE